LKKSTFNFNLVTSFFEIGTYLAELEDLGDYDIVKNFSLAIRVGIPLYRLLYLVPILYLSTYLKNIPNVLFCLFQNFPK